MDSQRSVEVCYAGPSSPSISKTSSGTSNRTRRSQGSSNTDEAPPFLGDSEVINEDFHCGGPHLVRLPAMNDHFKPGDPLQVAWDSQLREPTIDILEQYQVDYIGTGVVRRSPLVDDFDPVNWHDTVLITAHKHEIDDRWYLGSKKALELFREKGFTGLNIEILDGRACQPTLTFPISCLDPFLTIWQGLRKNILNILSHQKWIILSILRRGPSEGENEITIAITVAQDSTEDWSVVREQIVQLLDNQKQYHIAIEITRGTLWNKIYQLPMDEPLLNRRDWSTNAKLGGSLGPHNSEASACTFGGFLEVKFETEGWLKFGVTNYHCVIGGVDFDTLPLEEWNKRGMKPGDQRNAFKLDHPSLRDHKYSLTHCQKTIDDGWSSIPEDERRRIEEGDMSIPRHLINRFERQTKYAKDFRDLIDHGRKFAENDGLYIGTVHSASGLRLCQSNKGILDWALIRVSKERIFENELPQPDDVHMSYRIRYSPASRTVQGIAALKDEMRLFKYGRRTGFTGGRLNGIQQSDIHGWFENENGKLEFYQGKAYTIVPEGVTPFGDPGDSGSFVVDEEGRFAGLYFGGDMGRGTGLFIEAKELFQDIMYITGATDVRVPGSLNE